MAVKTGPAGKVDMKGGSPVGTMMSWRLTEEVAFHQRGKRVAVYELRERDTACQTWIRGEAELGA